jgi:hypothetical protein
LATASLHGLISGIAFGVGPKGAVALIAHLAGDGLWQPPTKATPIITKPTILI